jgi:hypothetical protein
MKRRKQMSRSKQGTLKNEILEIHAEWLDYNHSKVEGDKCRKQAQEYSQKTDERQTRNRRKYERHVV